MTATEFRAHLARTGLSVRACAAWLGIAPRTVSRYTAGELPVPRQTAMLITGRET